MKIKLTWLVGCLFFLTYMNGSFYVLAENSEVSDEIKLENTTTKKRSEKSDSEKEGHDLIAVVDMKKVASDSKSGKSIESQISEINNHSKKDLLDLESKIKSMESNKVSDADARKIEDMQLILYDMVRTKRYQISEAYRNAFLILEKEMKNVISSVAKRKNIKMVINSDAVMYVSEDSIDITKEVLDVLNERLPSIQVKTSEQ